MQLKELNLPGKVNWMTVPTKLKTPWKRILAIIQSDKIVEASMVKNSAAHLFITALLSIVVLVFAPSFSGKAAEGGIIDPDTEPVPLYFAIDHFGHVSVTSGIMNVPTRLMVWNKPQTESRLTYFDDLILEVRFDGKIFFYNLRKHSVQLIQFDRGYYSAIRLDRYENRILLEVQRTFVRNDLPAQGLKNQTAIQVITGRRSCLESAFHSRMYGTVVQPVRLRKLPYIPEDLDHNWEASLRAGEIVYIIITYCNAGSWLKIERASGRIGFAKEWGLTEDLIERTFIVPLPKAGVTPTPRPTSTPFVFLTPPPTVAPRP